MAERCFQPLRGLDQFAKVQSGFEASPLKHVDDIFCGNVPCRGGGEWTAANSAATGIDNINTRFDSCGNIG